MASEQRIKLSARLKAIGEARRIANRLFDGCYVADYVMKLMNETVRSFYSRRIGDVDFGSQEKEPMDSDRHVLQQLMGNPALLPYLKDKSSKDMQEIAKLLGRSWGGRETKLKASTDETAKRKRASALDKQFISTDKINPGPDDSKHPDPGMGRSNSQAHKRRRFSTLRNPDLKLNFDRPGDRNCFDNKDHNATAGRDGDLNHRHQHESDDEFPLPDRSEHTRVVDSSSAFNIYLHSERHQDHDDSLISADISGRADAMGSSPSPARTPRALLDRNVNVKVSNDGDWILRVFSFGLTELCPAPAEGWDIRINEADFSKLRGIIRGELVDLHLPDLPVRDGLSAHFYSLQSDDNGQEHRLTISTDLSLRGALRQQLERTKNPDFNVLVKFRSASSEVNPQVPPAALSRHTPDSDAPNSLQVQGSTPFNPPHVDCRAPVAEMALHSWRVSRSYMTSGDHTVVPDLRDSYPPPHIPYHVPVANMGLRLRGVTSLRIKAEPCVDAVVSTRNANG